MPKKRRGVQPLNLVIGWIADSPGRRTVIRLTKYSKRPEIQFVRCYLCGEGTWRCSPKIVSLFPERLDLLIEALQHLGDRVRASGTLKAAQALIPSNDPPLKAHNVLEEGLGPEWDQGHVGKADFVDFEFDAWDHAPAQGKATVPDLSELL